MQTKKLILSITQNTNPSFRIFAAVYALIFEEAESKRFELFTYYLKELRKNERHCLDVYSWLVESYVSNPASKAADKAACHAVFEDLCHETKERSKNPNEADRIAWEYICACEDDDNRVLLFCLYCQKIYDKDFAFTEDPPDQGGTVIPNSYYPLQRRLKKMRYESRNETTPVLEYEILYAGKNADIDSLALKLSPVANIAPKRISDLFKSGKAISVNGYETAIVCADIAARNNAITVIKPKLKNAKQNSEISGFLCSHCGMFVPKESDFCPSCGINIIQANVPIYYTKPLIDFQIGDFCSYCGSMNMVDSCFCACCGRKMNINLSLMPFAPLPDDEDMPF